MAKLRDEILRALQFLAKRGEELRDKVKVVVGALQTRVPHVRTEIGKHAIEIGTGGYPSIQIGECKMMSEIIGTSLIAVPASRHCRIPDFPKGYTQT